MIKRMESMKETLMNCVQSQLGDLSSVDAKELGEAVDMIKDFSEAIYYCTITESMKEKEKEPKYYVPMNYNDNRYYTPTEYTDRMYYRDMDRYYDGRMYYNGNSSSGNSSTGGNGSSSMRNYPVEIRDYREGNSPMSRRNYMEHKEMHRGKEVKMQELEKYMHELTKDITEMIEDSSPEEKQLLQKKLTALATKIV